MRTREEAARLLLENGWNLEEVNRVLGQEVKVTITPMPVFYPVIQPVPYLQPGEPAWRRIEITCEAAHIPTPYTPTLSQEWVSSNDVLESYRIAEAVIP